MTLTTIEKIVIARRRAGFSQAELAERTDISRPMIWKIEAGESSPRLSQLTSIARVLGVAVADLLGSDAPSGDESAAKMACAE